MAVSISKFPANNLPVSGDGWDNPTNAYADDANYATKAGPCSSDFYNWGFAVPSNALIHEVVIAVKCKASGTSIYNLFDVLAFFNDTQILNTNFEEATTEAVTYTSIERDFTPAEINSIGTSGLRVRVGAGITDGTPTFSLNHVQVLVLYTVPVGTFILKTPNVLGGTLWTNSTNVKSKFGGSATATNTTGEMIASDFGFNIPEGVSIHGITLLVRATRVTSGNQVGMQIAYNGTKRGTVSNQTTQNYAYTYISLAVGEWTREELNSNLLQVYIKAVNSYLYCDMIAVLVDYSLPLELGQSREFPYTGAIQYIQFKAGKRYLIECFGAQGCSPDPARANRQGGLGGYVWGVYEPTQDETINIYVGQQPTGATGGWNGGGNGGSCGGGGASDIRSGGAALSNRLLVAGGGGGGSPNDSFKQQGAAGGSTGAVGANWNGTNKYGLGGTQSVGGSNGGTLGVGGAATDGFWTGGGGGGYYGGGGATGKICGGGGGSSWYGGVLLGGSLGTYNEGHGKVYITEVSTTNLAAETTFNYTGHPQLARLKKGKYRVSCYGAQGGSSANQPTNIPGKGGYCAADVEITTECYILVMVGGKGGTKTGGWNGGGKGGGGGISTPGGGGGASDIRFNGGRLEDRILIAGGGAGGQTAILGGVPTSGVEGSGGGLTGTTGKLFNAPAGLGGTQSAPGTGGYLGRGVDGEISGGYDTPGGGGGLYGGGKGGGYSQSGGGSSYFSPILSSPLTLSGVNTGLGYVVITPLATTKPRRYSYVI